ncbi:hypothetical protein ACNKU7_01085 [Microbulbifer sp. SA54]|uniref:hypothetical protein n=1 Tax=Microbulbifer sp. SA54 TaxID=3401577 RepID=UPI003AAE0190
MKGKIFATLLLAFGISGCDTLGRIALEQATDSRIRYGAQCESLRMQCRPENYRQWQTSKGELGCSCAGSPEQSRYPTGIQDPL